MFEYDENKSQSNFIKHGIDFVTAQQLWDDPDRLEIPFADPSRTEEVDLYESSRL